MPKFIIKGDCMKLNFEKGEFVYREEGLNYQEVLDDFKNAEKIRIITYNISKKEKGDELISLLRDLPDATDVQIITNIPSRFNEYYNSRAGEAMRTAFKKNCDIYLKKLNPLNFSASVSTSFNFSNHAKIIGTENLVYIGSANYSDESKFNIETGILIRDKEFIDSLFEEFFESVKEDSVPYFDDDYNTLRLFAVSMETKFKIHLQKLQEEVFYDNKITGMRGLSDYTSLERDDLYKLGADIDELLGLSTLIENTYSEEDEEYNESIEAILNDIEDFRLDWMIQFVMEDSDFFNYVRFDMDDKVNECLEEYSAEAYDEYLEEYVDRAMNDAQEIWSDMIAELEPESLEFIDEMKKVVSKLEEIHERLMELAGTRISPNIDNS